MHSFTTSKTSLMKRVSAPDSAELGAGWNGLKQVLTQCYVGSVLLFDISASFASFKDRVRARH